MLNIELFVTDMLKQINTAVFKPGVPDITTGTDHPTFSEVSEELHKAEVEGKKFLKVVEYLKTVHADRQHLLTAMEIKPSELIEAIEQMSRQNEAKAAVRARRDMELMEANKAFQNAQANAEIRPYRGE